MSKRILIALGLASLFLGAAGLACNFSVGSQATPTVATPTTLADQPAMPTPLPNVIQPESASATQAAIYALAIYLGRDPTTFSVISAYETQFDDTSLGCPREGETPTQEVTAGYTVHLSDGEQEYEIHTSLDGLRVRCLSNGPAPGNQPGNAGIIATINALENQEYGTLASLLPATIILATYPDTEQTLDVSAFVAQLKDIWLTPGDLDVDLNINVLAMMPSLSLPSNHIPVFSTGWGAARDTDGILFFDLSGEAPVLDRLLFIPSSQKTAAYGPQSPAEEKAQPGPGSIFRGVGFSLEIPAGWISTTVGSTVDFLRPGSGVAIRVEPWPAPEPPRDGQTFRSWIEEKLPTLMPGFEGLSSMDPIWASSGQAGYLIKWHSRREDGALTTSNPVALFQLNQLESDDGAHALSFSLIDPAELDAFQTMLLSTVIEPPVGVPTDMAIYRHDELGFRIQFPVEWKLLPSPLGAAFQPPEQDVAISVGPWPLLDGPAPGQPFEQWVATAPAESMPGYGSIKEIRTITATGGTTGYLASWQITAPGGLISTSNPVAVFPFQRQLPENGTIYHALAISLHVPTYTQVFERMVATLVIEQMDAAEMVFVPAGAFVRGSNEEQIRAWQEACGASCRPNEFLDESPQRLVSLDGFYIDRTEVTVAQFKEFVAATGYQTTSEQKGDPIEYTWRSFDSADRQDHPVRWMSWEDSNAYCQWAGKRLPTEAEWEKAARGADGRTWPWGNQWDEGRVPHNDTVPAESYENGASPYGALGMAGNVWEWVQDWYDPAYFGSAPDSNPQGPPAGTDRVLRGGGYNNSSWTMRTTHRHSGGARGYAIDHGFRCASDG